MYSCCAVLYAGAAMTVLGTPEFMAPELYEENYTAKVDGERATQACEVMHSLYAAARLSS